jgi:hypothetical protein
VTLVTTGTKLPRGGRTGAAGVSALSAPKLSTLLGEVVSLLAGDASRRSLQIPSKGAIADGINILEQEPEWMSGKYHSVRIGREIK